LTAYVLDLRALFPCGSTNGGEAYWRDHAIRLERDYAALKIRFEEREIRESLILSQVKNDAYNTVTPHCIPNIRIVHIC
jgi:hypothetical protein